MSDNNDITSAKDFTLQHPGGCSGMYWRGAPAGLSHRVSGSQPDWPRNGAILRGFVHELAAAAEGNTKWLEVVEISPSGVPGEFVPAPESWMPFTQGGLLLHEVN